LRISSTTSVGALILLLEQVARLVLVLAPFEVLDGVDDLRVVAREVDVGDWRQRVHDRDEIERPELVLDELGQRLTHGKRAAEPRVIVVQENDEHPRVVACRFALLIIPVANLLRGRLTRLGIAVDFDETEGLDLLRLVVLEDFEVRLLLIGRGLALRIGHVRIDGDKVDSRSEGELGLVGRLLPGRRLGGTLLGPEREAAGECQGDGHKNRGRDAHSNHHNP